MICCSSKGWNVAFGPAITRSPPGRSITTTISRRFSGAQGTMPHSITRVMPVGAKLRSVVMTSTCGGSFQSSSIATSWSSASRLDWARYAFADGESYWGSGLEGKMSKRPSSVTATPLAALTLVSASAIDLLARPESGREGGMSGRIACRIPPGHLCGRDEGRVNR